MSNNCFVQNRLFVLQLYIHNSCNGSCTKSKTYERKSCPSLQYSDFDCRPGNRDKLRYSQAELGPAIRSAVAYFADISGRAIEIRVL